MPPWKFLDCDAMIGASLVPPPAPVATAGDLLREMDRFGIDRALVYHYHRLKSSMNRLTLDDVKTSPRLLPCWALPIAPMTLDEKLEDHVEEMFQAGGKAARLVPDSGPTAGPMTLRPFLLGGVFERLNRHRIPLLIPADHFPAAVPYGFDQIHEICGAYPDIPVILLQLRFSTQAQLIALMRLHLNLYFTISWFGLFRQVESMAKMFSAERLLYGSGLPVGDPATGIGMVSYGKFTAREKDLIAGGNLNRLLKGVR